MGVRVVGGKNRKTGKRGGEGGGRILGPGLESMALLNPIPDPGNPSSCTKLGFFLAENEWFFRLRPIQGNAWNRLTLPSQNINPSSIAISTFPFISCAQVL